MFEFNMFEFNMSDFNMSEFKNLSNQDAIFFSLSFFQVLIYICVCVKKL